MVRFKATVGNLWIKTITKEQLNDIVGLRLLMESGFFIEKQPPLMMKMNNHPSS